MTDIQNHTFRGSERVSSGTYDPMKKTVILTFPDGVRFLYKPVSQKIWNGLIKADSPSHYLVEVLNDYASHKL